jgi:hypothetical protein
MENIRPGVYNIDLIQNENFDVTLVLRNKLTGEPYIIEDSQVFLQVKEASRQHVIISLAIGSGLSITETDRLRIFMSKAQTRKLSGPRYLYDILFLLDGGANPRYLIKGQINVQNTITTETT